MTTPLGKIRIVLEMTPPEKEQWEELLRVLGTTKIGFVRSKVLEELKLIELPAEKNKQGSFW